MNEPRLKVYIYKPKEIVISNDCNDFYFSVDLFCVIYFGWCIYIYVIAVVSPILDLL